MHPLDGPRAKVKRAKSQLIALHQALQRFFKEHPYSIVKAEFNRNAGYYNIRIKDVPPAFPDEWSVIIGEIVHNLRSALDGLTWQLALLNTTSTPYHRTAFPIRLLSHGTKPRIDGGIYQPFWQNGKPNKLLKSIDKRYQDRIEKSQPYKRGKGGRHSPLFLLEELNNTDKHRLITVLVTTVAGIEFRGLAGRTEFKIGVPMYPNTIVGHVYPLPYGVPVLDFSNGRPIIRTQEDMQVNLDIIPGICFGDGCDAVKRRPVIRTLKSILDNVSSIIESFADDF